MLLAVDANRKNLEIIDRILREKGFECLTASTLEEFDLIVEGSEKPELAILDVSGFGRDIWKRCEKLQSSSVPFFIIYPSRREKPRGDLASHGAHHILEKPLIVNDFLRLIGDFIGGVGNG